MTSWWTGLEPAQTTVTCGGADHRLRWADGVLTAPDHDDIDGERAMAVLGGERCACVDVLDAWARRADDPMVLLLARRGPTDVLGIDEDDAPWAVPSAASGAVGWASYVPLSSVGFVTAGAASGMPAPADPGPDASDEIIGLLALGGGLADRLVATTAARWRDRATDHPAPLHAALYGRALATLRTWLAEPDLELELELVADDAPRTLTRDGTTLHAALPFGWLLDVWTRGFAVVADRFVLAATPSPDGSRWALDAVGSGLDAPSRIVLDLDPAD
jgi:hypothetical protein